MRIPLIAVATGTLLSLVGCATFRNDPSLFSDNSLYGDYGVGPLKIDEQGAAVKLRNALIKSADHPDHLVDAACFDVPVRETKLPCDQERNEAIATLLNVSDDMCQAHLKTIFGNEAAFNITAGTVATLTSGAAAIAGGQAAKSALSAISTFSNGERSLVNETVYKQMLVTAVATKIREAREVKLTAIYPAGFRRSIDEYPMTTAIHDVLGYHYACSFMLGLQKALDEGKNPGPELQMAKLKQEEAAAEQALDVRTAELRAAKLSAQDISEDPGVTGARNRIAAIEAKLLSLISQIAPAAASAGK